MGRKYGTFFNGVSFIYWLLISLIPLPGKCLSKKNIVINVLHEGAVGNATFNNHDVFARLSQQINARGGKTTLFFPKGIYIVGKQTENQKPGAPYQGQSVFTLQHVAQVKFVGEEGTIIRFANALRFGSFDPKSLLPFTPKLPFTDAGFKVNIGNLFHFIDCNQIEINQIEGDGNASHIFYGGPWGDVDRQCMHIGIFIQNCNNIQLQSASMHHFGLDGIQIANARANTNNWIMMRNCRFEYNLRQGFSWVGGQGLTAEYCSFNYNGLGNESSAPRAGIDIESEVSPIRQGHFYQCEMIDNGGVGVLADTGPSSEIDFKQCRIIGTRNWSVWVTKPSYTFRNCYILGSITHGYAAPDNLSATRFIYCSFSDSLFHGQKVFGNYLVECNGSKRMRFDNCRFIAQQKKLLYVNCQINNDSERVMLTGCTLVHCNPLIGENDFIALLRGVSLKKNQCIDTCTKKNIYIETMGAYGDKSNHIQSFSHYLKWSNPISGSRDVF